jgi:Fe2+ or Zn2+ uptake regulation protein
MKGEARPSSDFLLSRGFKSTGERRIILQELETRQNYFSAEDLYTSLKRKGLRVGDRMEILEAFGAYEKGGGMCA